MRLDRLNRLCGNFEVHFRFKLVVSMRTFFHRSLRFYHLIKWINFFILWPIRRLIAWKFNNTLILVHSILRKRGIGMRIPNGKYFANITWTCHTKYILLVYGVIYRFMIILVFWWYCVIWDMGSFTLDRVIVLIESVGLGDNYVFIREDFDVVCGLGMLTVFIQIWYARLFINYVNEGGHAIFGLMFYIF